MFRVSQFMREIVEPTPARPYRDAPGPVVIWNLIRRCNLNCKHCYSLSTDTNFPGELSAGQVTEVMGELRAFGVPVLILSGGEPLLRPDIFALSAQARRLGFYVALSTNGTLIDDANIDAIADAGYDYVGISLDGIGAVHDGFRRHDGAYQASMAGVRRCRARAIKVGLRFTMTLDNAHLLADMLDLAEAEGIEKFYLSHLNYAGRGNKNRGEDASHAVTRRAMDLLFERAWRDAEAGRALDIVTGNNDADGVYLLQWMRRRFPEKLPHMLAKLRQWGGNATGVNVANIDNLGNVHPDTMWGTHTLGNVLERRFSDIWSDTSDPVMAGLKRHPRQVGGRCGQCGYLDICNGNTRTRALQTAGDMWAEDPGCYLTDDEIARAGEEQAVVAA